MKSHRLKAYIYLLIVAVIWGAAGPIIKYTLQEISPLPFLAYRFAISAVFSILFFILFGVKFPKPKENLPLVLIYGLMAFPIALGVLFLGLEKTTVLDMTLISLLAPLLVAIGGVVFFKEHVTNREKTGIAIVVSGAIFTAISPIIMDHQVLRLSGNLLIGLFLLAESIAVLIAKQVARKKVPSLTLINIGFIIGAITVIPLTIFLYGYSETINSIINLPLKYHLCVWYMALLSGTLAYFLYILAQKSIEVSEAALFRYLLPLFSIPLAVFWLGEKISIYFVIGAVLITIGITIAEYKKRR
ncbi:DMT family transporter [Patescibacteria group bacterium]|nr:DMT family transporter [Patescibacteria group bacterium]MBU0777144.1 DMT family transporter [Patescibacteria group bacterium]MBU0845838.1 DMT family transporter [Patescibacteria group bacterium]MBU0922865.1 DMT family transporter [Patescibacteria group bacterium]MBU1066402.1 DMT family transporter [Patescibacteria group bacterium]